jgi:hypothetical protein
MSRNIWPTNYFTQKTEKTDNNDEKIDDETEEPELISKDDIIDSLPETVEAPDENTTTDLLDVEEEKDAEEEAEEEKDAEEEAEEEKAAEEEAEEEAEEKEEVIEDTDDEDNDEEDEIRDSENDDFEADNTHRLTSAFDSGISTSDLFLASYKVNRALETYIVSINTKPIYYNNDPNSAKKLMWGVVKSFVRNLTLNHPEYNVRLAIVSDNKVKIFTSYRFYAISYESLLHTISFNRAVQATPTNA